MKKVCKNNPSYVKLKLTREGKKITIRKKDQKTRINKTISIKLWSRKHSRYTKFLKRFTRKYDRRTTTSRNK